MKYDLIIIGSGMSGLTAALILSKEGMKVLVVEQHYQVGGLLHTFTRKGVSFDTGLHYIGAVSKGHILWNYLEYLDVNREVEYIPYNQNCFDKICYPDLVFEMPVGYEHFKENLYKCFPQEKEAINKFIKKIQSAVKVFPFYNLLSEENVEAERKYNFSSTWEFLNSITENQKLKKLLYDQRILNGIEGMDTPISVTSLILDGFVKGSYSVNGGGSKLAGAFVKRIKEAGGEIMLSSKVTKIITKNKLIVGIEINNKEIIEADMVIASAHPKKILKLIGPGNFTKAYTKRVLNLEESLTGMAFHVITNKKVISVNNSNVHRFFDKNINENITNYGDSMGKKPKMVWYSIPSQRHKNWSKKGDAIFGLYPISYKEVEQWKDSEFGNRPDAYQEFKEKHKEYFLSIIENDMPEIKGHIEYIDVASPLTYEHFINTENGSFYGIKHNCSQQPPYGVLSTCKIKNLFFTGQSIILPGIVGVAISAFHTASKIIGMNYLINKVKRVL